jgi:hypothetical protein
LLSFRGFLAVECRLGGASSALDCRTPVVQDSSVPTVPCQRGGRQSSVPVLGFLGLPSLSFLTGGDAPALPMRLCVRPAQSRFPGAPTGRCRVRLQRPIYIKIYYNTIRVLRWYLIHVEKKLAAPPPPIRSPPVAVKYLR